MKIKTLLLAAGLAAMPLLAHAETHAVIETDMGNIELILDEQKAPKTVANFVQYANQGFYNDTIFHRVIDGFMIQGGGFNQNMLQKPTKQPIVNEADNGLKNRQYTIAMARTGDPHSATSQFFINLTNNESLDFRQKDVNGYGYAVFGRVSKGTEVVNKIAKVRTISGFAHQNVPQKPIIIKRVKIIK